MSDARKDSGSVAESALCLLVASPDGLSSRALAGRIAAQRSPVSPSPDAAVASALTRMERLGFVVHDGPRRKYIWSITGSGLARLEAGDPRKRKRGFTHGAQYAYSRAGCRCEACRAWAAAEHQKYFARHPEKAAGATARLLGLKLADPEKDRKVQARAKVKQQARNAESAAAAIARGRHWQRWTGPDLEMAARTDLSLAQIAVMIGRSEKSVSCMRQRLGDASPRDRMLANGPAPPTSRSGPR